ncbi:MAG: sulfotransferase domain-containing protein [Xanthobacteraceae bacterium]|nr:sulfotransferase domain-containing protein [Xanthobacteraceae bacterium]
MATPNLFILGAGKCGTTSLYDLLGGHPDIMVSNPKEPSFFCSHFQVVKNPVDYFRLFNSPKRYRVDSSHVYFSNPETSPLLRDLFPDAKFLVMLRHPKARAHSLYRHMRRAMHEDGRPLELAERFHEALLLEAERFRSLEFFANCRHYFWNFMYLRSSIYDEQLDRYFRLYPRENFLVMSLAEFRREPDRVKRTVAEFLNIDVAGFGPEAPFSNAAPPHDSYDAASDAVMEQYFGNLTARVDRLLGRSLDWSL